MRAVSHSVRQSSLLENEAPRNRRKERFSVCLAASVYVEAELESLRLFVTSVVRNSFGSKWHKLYCYALFLMNSLSLMEPYQMIYKYRKSIAVDSELDLAIILKTVKLDRQILRHQS